MAVLVYNHGKGHIEHGIECKVERIDPKFLDGMLGAGWVLDPRDLVKPKEEARTDEPVQEPKKRGRKPKAVADESHEG